MIKFSREAGNKLRAAVKMAALSSMRRGSYIAGQKARDQLGTEMNHDSSRLRIIMRRNRSRNACLQVLSTLACLFEIVTRCHEFASVLN